MKPFPTDDKERKTLAAWTYLTEYFPDAFLAEIGVAVAGNRQYNPGEPLHWAREKSKDQLNTAFRHMWDHKAGVTKDTDGQYHLAKAIWRLKAELQLTIEADRAVQSQRSSVPAAQLAPEVLEFPHGSPQLSPCASPAGLQLIQDHLLSTRIVHHPV